jgi:hypothetical protein
MKKYFAILAVSSLIVFAGCKKENTNQAYSIEGNKIVMNIAGELPTDDATKQSWNGERLRIFFNSGDQININGVDYSLSCYPSNIPGTSTAASNYARVTCDLADAYYMFYPANIYTVTPDNSTTPATYAATVAMPAEVSLINNNAMVNFATMNDVPVWPLYTYLDDAALHPTTTGATTDDGARFELKNAVAIAAPQIRYGQEWAEIVFGDTYATPEDCPTLYVTDVVITADQVLNGAATLNTANPAAPYIVMDATATDNTNNKIVCHLDNAMEITAQAGVNQMLGNVAVPLLPQGTTFQVNIYFHTVINGTTTYYKYESRESQNNNKPFARSGRTFFNFNFQTIGGTGNGVVITSQATPFTVE